jgi:hypothetical protein
MHTGGNAARPRKTPPAASPSGLESDLMKICNKRKPDVRCDGEEGLRNDIRHLHGSVRLRALRGKKYKTFYIVLITEEINSFLYQFLL